MRRSGNRARAGHAVKQMLVCVALVDCQASGADARESRSILIDTHLLQGDLAVSRARSMLNYVRLMTSYGLAEDRTHS